MKIYEFLEWIKDNPLITGSWKVCPKCKAVLKISKTTCHHCGYGQLLTIKK